MADFRSSAKAHANARNIVGQQDATLLGPTCCKRLHTMLCDVACCCDLLEVLGRSFTSFKLHPTTSNKSQQHATTHNMVCKRSQHVGPNNVASCWPTMLRAFSWAFRNLSCLRTNYGKKGGTRLIPNVKISWARIVFVWLTCWKHRQQ